MGVNGMRYRKKPVEIDAFQFKSSMPVDQWPDWARDAWGRGVIRRRHKRANNGELYEEVMVQSLEGAVIGTDGDWIIKGIKGELYICDDDIFKMTYERVE